MQIGYSSAKEVHESKLGAENSEYDYMMEEPDVGRKRNLVAASALDWWVAGEIDKTRLSTELEKGSVYGSSLAFPQIAQSVRWSSLLLPLVVRSYFFLLVNYFVQFCFLYFINVEQYYWDRFAGQPNLCDFGAPVGSNQDAARGPGGTIYTPERLYTWQAWSTRNFVKQSLLQLFPHLQEEINEEVDPGEYGLESFFCRWMCCFIFIVSTTPEFKSICGMVRLLYVIPTRAEPWVSFHGRLAK